MRPYSQKRKLRHGEVSSLRSGREARLEPEAPRLLPGGRFPHPSVLSFRGWGARNDRNVNYLGLESRWGGSGSAEGKSVGEGFPPTARGLVKLEVWGWREGEQRG